MAAPKLKQTGTATTRGVSGTTVGPALLIAWLVQEIVYGHVIMGNPLPAEIPSTVMEALIISLGYLVVWLKGD